MADIKSSEERSQNMARIHSKDTKPEVWFRKQLFKYGYRYRKHINSLPGHPDLWLSKYNTAIFVHGCFWHHHNGCKFAYMPKSRVDFWQKKFKNNIMRECTTGAGNKKYKTADYLGVYNQTDDQIGRI